MNSQRKTAVITGASSGIGAAFARRLAGEGFDLMLHGRREERLQALCKEVRSLHGISAEYVVAELSDPGDLTRLEHRVRQTANLVMLVNNAGSSSILRFYEEDIDVQESIMRVHINASVRLTHAALAVMLPRRDGAIINVSSVAASFISPGSVIYCASKLFLKSFTESLHLELRNTGVRVQVLCPGYTATEFHARLGYDTSGAFFRNFMSAEEVVDISLRYLHKGKVVCIPGLKYRLAVLLPHLIPRPLLYKLTLRVTGGRKYPPK